LFSETQSGISWAEQLGIHLEALYTEAFWHPVAAYENDRIRKQGEAYWAWVRHCNPEPPSRVARMEAKKRPMFEFTERQLEIALRSLGGS
jgi:hypothetical protein